MYGLLAKRWCCHPAWRTLLISCCRVSKGHQFVPSLSHRSCMFDCSFMVFVFVCFRFLPFWLLSWSGFVEEAVESKYVFVCFGCTVNKKWIEYYLEGGSMLTLPSFCQKGDMLFTFCFFVLLVISLFYWVFLFIECSLSGLFALVLFASALLNVHSWDPSLVPTMSCSLLYRRSSAVYLVIRRVPFSWLIFSDMSLIKSVMKYSKNNEMSQLTEEPT